MTGPEDHQVGILLVDDQQAELAALEATLERLGQRLVRARSGREALRILLQQDFAVILIDIRMPVMDGNETLGFIRGRERSASTPVIFVTASHPDEIDVAAGYARASGKVGVCLVTSGPGATNTVTPVRDCMARSAATSAGGVDHRRS